MPRRLPWIVLLLVLAGLAGLARLRPGRDGPSSVAREPDSVDRTHAPPLELDASAERADALGGPTASPAEPQDGSQDVLGVPLPALRDTRVFGIVSDAESGRPIARARVELRDGHDEPRPGGGCTSGDDGRFELVYRPAARPHLRIEAAGYGARRADPAGHDDPTRALPVELSRACTLELCVRDAAGAPLAGVLARLTAKGYALDLASSTSGFFMREHLDVPDESWQVETGADGRATFAELPAGVELRSELTWLGRRARLEPDPLTLAPGETRALEVRLGSGTRIRGLVLDLQGRAVARQEVLLASCPRDPWSRSLLLESGQVQARATTDDLGRFAFESLEPGCWRLAPARGTHADAPAALPAEVVTAGEPEIAVTLRAARGLFLAGRVLAPDGRPVAGARVEAYADGEWFWDDAHADLEGRFRLGPVTTDAYTLVACGRDGLADSEPLRAHAGEELLELRLRRGGLLRGRVVDGASGAACAAQVLWTPELRGFGPFGMGMLLASESDGRFELRGLAPGRGGLAALSSDGRFAVLSGLEHAAGEAGGEVVLALEPGGRLALHHGGTRAPVFVTVTRAGVPVHFGERLACGGRARVLAPAGDLVLELREDPLGQPRRLRASLAPGATLEVELGD